MQKNSFNPTIRYTNCFKTQQQNHLRHKFFAAEFNDLVMNVLYIRTK